MKFDSLRYLGVLSLFQKEIKRFIKLFTQTLVAPLITTLLYLMIFGLGFQNKWMAPGVSFLSFVIPGLTAMAVINNAFGNTTASIMSQKYQQTLAEIFFTPLSAFEIATAIIFGGILRGVLVALSTLFACWVFSPFPIMHPFGLAAATVLLSVFFGGLGIVAALWADSFDKVSYFSTFLITPLSFLGGVFYSISHLPEFWQRIALLNPMFYFVNFFRWACMGWTDFPVAISFLLLFISSLMIFSLVIYLYQVGYKIKS